jgi:hypothetical protein
MMSRAKISSVRRVGEALDSSTYSTPQAASRRSFSTISSGVPISAASSGAMSVSA